MAYLAYYREFWNCLLAPDEHRHEVGEDVTGCYNCNLEGLADKMSKFELACWNWYCDNVSPFALEAGIVGEMFRGEGLVGGIKAMFLTAMNSIYQAMNFIQADMQRKAAEGAHG